MNSLAILRADSSSPPGLLRRSIINAVMPSPFELGQRLFKFIRGRFVELRDAHVANAVFEDFCVLHAVHVDLGALDRVVFDLIARVLGFGAEYGNGDFRPGSPRN